MGVMIPMKRERMLTIRVTDDEHARLLERCEGKTNGGMDAAGLPG